jgi:hypothetical protein
MHSTCLRIEALDKIFMLDLPKLDMGLIGDIIKVTIVALLLSTTMLRVNTLHLRLSTKKAS